MEIKRSQIPEHVSRIVHEIKEAMGERLGSSDIADIKSAVLKVHEELFLTPADDAESAWSGPPPNDIEVCEECRYYSPCTKPWCKGKDPHGDCGHPEPLKELGTISVAWDTAACKFAQPRLGVV